MTILGMPHIRSALVYDHRLRRPRRIWHLVPDAPALSPGAARAWQFEVDAAARVAAGHKLHECD